MATSVDTFISNVLNTANSIAANSVEAISAGNLIAEQGPQSVTSSNIAYPQAIDASELTGLPEPVSSDISEKLNEMIGDIANLYNTYFPDYAEQVAALAEAAGAMGEAIENDDYSTHDVSAEMSLIVAEQNEQNRIKHQRIVESYARRGFSAAPGMLIRETTDTYQFDARQILARKLALIDESIGGVVDQHKIYLNELLITANKSRALAINASATLISTAAKHSAFPSRNYASLVDIKSAMADAILVKYNADKTLNERMLRVYAGNADIRSMIDRYNANMRQEQIGNITNLAVAKAENIGNEAGSLWNAINLIASSSTISFG